MILPMRTGVQAHADTPVSELLEQWIGEQLGRGAEALGLRPRIGILAAGGTLRDGGWPVYGSDAPTVHAILEAGGLPCSIPALPLLEGYDPVQLLSDEHTFALLFDVFWPVMRSLDGLVLSGGGDVSACLYGKPPHSQAETPDLWRDVCERSLALLSWVLCLPTLGICRGMQLMNVALGGTLYQDLRAQWPRDRPQLVRHRARGRVSSSNWVTHPVQLTRRDSRLARALKGRGEPGRRLLDAVLSMHHQAVETLAPGLSVAATAPDGVIEAFEDTSPARWWVATQFHPEWSTQLHWVMGLFTSFVDASSSGRAPLPIQGGVAAAWVRRYWRVERPPLQLEQCALPRGLWWDWLVECSQSSRGYLPLTLLASGVAVILGSVWGAVPTPFAATLSATHTLEKLDWLLGGQAGVVLLGACLLLFVARGVIGFPDRLVPASWQAPARILTATAPLAMATGLVALGLPFLQAPWWLAASLGGYTLASAAWGLLLPRLRPTVSALAQSRRHLLLAQGRALPTPLHLAHANAREAQVTRLLATVESLLIAVLAPLLGWLIDARDSVDAVLVSVGLGFLATLLAVMVIAILVPSRRRTRSPRRVASSVNRYRAHPVSSHQVRPAW